LEILVLALEILHEESSQIGLEINWSKTKLQVFDDTSTPPSKSPVTSVIAKRRLRQTSSVRTSCESRPITKPLAFFDQPSIILQRIGDAGQIDQGGHGSVQ